MCVQVGRLSKMFRASQAEQEERAAVPEALDVLEQIEQRRLGPVDVVDGKDERPLAREFLEDPSERPRDLISGGRVVARSDRTHDPRRDRGRVTIAGDDLGESALRGRCRRLA